MKILIDIPAEEYRWICKSDETWAANTASKECMMNAIKRGIVISKMTNGDVVKTLFSDTKCSVLTDNEEIIVADFMDFMNWLKEPYDKENKDGN